MRCEGTNQTNTIKGTAAHVGTSAANATAVTRTRTLKGMGPTRPEPGACSICHVKRDEEHDEPIDSAIAVAYGIAFALARGPEALKVLCPQHRSIVGALVNEIRNPSAGE